MTDKFEFTMEDVIALVPPFSEYAFDLLPDHYEADLSKFETELDTGTYIGWAKAFDERMKSIPVNEWMCTDTMVGVHAYYFDGRFVALSFQPARKSDTVFCWASKEDAQQVKNFIRTLYDLENEISVTLINPTQEISSDWLNKNN
jgi:hypothetical protein